MSIRYNIRYFFVCFIISIVVLNIIHPYNLYAVGNQALENAQADRARLQSEYDQLLKEIEQKQKELDSQKGQSVSLSRDIAILTTQIKKAKLDIQAKNIVIKKLGGEISQKNKTIEALSEKINTEKESLAQLIRKDREIDEKSLLTFILSKDKISDVYGDIDKFASIKDSIKESVHEIKNTKSQTELVKKNLEQKKEEETDVKVKLESIKKEVETTESRKQQLLSISKNKEKEYQKVLAEKAKRRSEILALLFNLRDASAIPFGRALEYATSASKSSGVDVAFILAIITQESNLGSNQGSCYITNMSTGEGISSNSNRTFRNVMKPTRDVGPFNEITLALGRDPYRTLVSCPIASAGSSSWGGAMGPAQFIPSTWKGMKSKVGKALGVSMPDPWNPEHAFMASAMFLADLGAIGDSYTAQIKAACRYYGSGGSSCTYGKQVMAKKQNIQTKMLDPLQN